MIFIKPAYDTDASAFFDTAGITSTAGKQQISRFVTGAKNIPVSGFGTLWSTMVCWPMRSYQNAEAGSLIYSLGGFATRNLTIEGSPQKSNDGMIFDGVADHLFGSQISLTQTKNIGYFGKISSFSEYVLQEDITVGRTAMYIDGTSLRTSFSPPYGIASVAQATAGDGIVISGLDVDVWHGAANYKGGTSVARGYNDSTFDFIQPASSIGYQVVGGLRIGMGLATAGSFSGTIAFAYYQQGQQASQQAAFYSLCRTTLLQGIPLP